MKRKHILLRTEIEMLQIILEDKAFLGQRLVHEKGNVSVTIAKEQNHSQQEKAKGESDYELSPVQKKISPVDNILIKAKEKKNE